MNYTQQRKHLVNLLRAKGIHDENVLTAIGNVARETFVNPAMQDYAYEDTALPLSNGQTISQPFIVAYMTQALLSNGQVDKVLEIGTGSGYQTAILAQVAAHVLSVERINALHLQAKQHLQPLKLDNVQLRYGDGCLGWPEHSPYTGILVTAAAKQVPPALLEQLADGGTLVIPVGDTASQALQVITRHGDDFHKQVIESVVFVPLLPGQG